MRLSLLCASNCIIELNHWKDFRSCLSVEIVSGSSTECRCRTMASQDHATSCASRSLPCWVHAVLVAMLPEGSQVRCVLHQLLVHKLPGAVHPSRSLHLFVVELQHGVLQVLPALPLEPPNCTGANTFPGLIQHSIS